MKANPRPVPLRRRPWRLGLVGGTMMLALASCTTPSVRQPPVVNPPPAPALPRSPISPAAPSDWHDAPVSPGTWNWTLGSAGSTAHFGGAGPQIDIYCPRGSRAVAMFVPTVPQSTGDTLLSLSTTTAARQFSAKGIAGGYSVSIPANDHLLDALAFTRGRFAVEIAGVAALVLPADPAISRVIEDCRTGF